MIGRATTKAGEAVRGHDFENAHAWHCATVQKRRDLLTNMSSASLLV